MAGYHGSEISTWTSDIPLDTNVSKVGRSTGWTDGRINGIRTDLRVRRREGNQEWDIYGRVRAWMIPTSSKSSTKFASPGDSGAWILKPGEGTQDPSVIGLFFCSQDASGFSYFIPFDLVVNDLERVTGAKVIFPTEAK